MVSKPKRKAFGPKRKKLYDLHHHKKEKKELSYKLPSSEASEAEIKHLRVDMRNI